MINYVFGLYDESGQFVDSTNLDENNPELAMDLFKEFAQNEGYTVNDTTNHYVMLLATEEE